MLGLKLIKMRNIPNLNSQLLLIMNRDDKRTEELYHKFMEKIEQNNEAKLIKILSSLGIQSSVKSNRYSLPYTGEIKHSRMGESYINGAYETEDFFRKVVKELLLNNIRKIRFYILMEVEDCFPMGKVNFKFRYYTH